MKAKLFAGSDPQKLALEVNKYLEVEDGCALPENVRVAASNGLLRLWIPKNPADTFLGRPSRTAWRVRVFGGSIEEINSQIEAEDFSPDKLKGQHLVPEGEGSWVVLLIEQRSL